MKKILKTMVLATMGLFALASCEDVPAPYITPGNGGGNGGNSGTNMATVDFTQGQGGWAAQDKSGLAGVWSNSGSYGMVASAFKSSKNNASESWLVSPLIDLTGASEVVLVVEEAVNKIGDGKVEEMMTVWASSEDGATWQQLSADKRPGGASWNFQQDEFDLSAYSGQKVKVAFKYVSTSESAGTWEIKSVSIKGKGEATIEGGGNNTPAATEITCAQAVSLTNALEDGATSTELYAITGYITEVVGNVSRNQQTFWMADTKDGGRVFEAYYANLPEGVSEFKAGTKVKITGNLMKYVGKDGKVTPESKNANVEILENGDGPTPPTPTGDVKGSGTVADPYNVAAAIYLASTLQKSTSTSNVFLSDEVYVKGTISQVDEINMQYGNATYYISDDGQTTTQLEVYRGFGLGGAKFTSDDDILVGDEVIVCGKLQNWLGTYEFTTGSKITSLNGQTGGNDTPDPQTGEAKGDGTLANPFNIPAANAYIAAGQNLDKEVCVAGIISEIKSLDVSKWQRAQYYISDDGSKDNQFLIYNGYYLDGADFTANDQIKVGDKVIVQGKLKNYNGTNEMDSNNKIVSINGQTGGGGDTPDPGNNPDPTGDTSSITFSSKGYSNAEDFDGQSITVGDATLTFSKGSGSTTPKYYNTGTAMRLYGGNTLTITSSKTIAKVEFTYNSGAEYTPTAQTCTVTPGTYDFSSHTWTGSATRIVLSNTASKGHFRLASIVITYAE
ncbi:MAG: choice-of-anchor J domain-containing protein [Bacteroidaceae bacterium]|nr:choice-of-anchor J domain-containing protein [Bacteroidaceae bacterium]